MSTAPPPPDQGQPLGQDRQFTSSRDAKAHAKADKAYRKATRPWYRKKRFWLLGLVGLLVLIALLSQGGSSDTDKAAPSTTQSANKATKDAAKPSDDKAAAKTSEEAAAEESSAKETTEEAKAPEALQVTAQDMIADLEKNALAAAKKYKDQRVTVTGYVSTIDASGDYFTLRGDDEISFTNIQFQIDDEHLDKVSSFEEGQQVTATGTVTDVGEILGYSIDTESIQD